MFSFLGLTPQALCYRHSVACLKQYEHQNRCNFRPRIRYGVARGGGWATVLAVYVEVVVGEILDRPAGPCGW